MSTKPKVLIVDDIEDFVELLEMRFVANGFDVVRALDGQEALDQVAREKPDLIILDLMLPKIDGYEVCSQIKGNRETKHIPIIMLTARAAMEDEKRGKNVGAEYYMRKPYDSDQLLDIAKEALGDKAPKK